MRLEEKSAQQIVHEFGLKPLAGEGGHFSVIQFDPAGNSIYFLLPEGDFSAWHRLNERETWVLLAGDPIDLHLYSNSYSKHTLDRSGVGMTHTVAPGEWMAAQTTGRWSLILCYLAPAFSGMELASSEQVRSWISMHPEVPELVHE